MKTKILQSVFLSLLFATTFAQDKTTVNATSSEISDNLDLRAVATIFAEAKDLEDFENKINDPKKQLSNLDLNNDNQVDYIRVIETVEGRTHIIVLQSVLEKDTYQDIATIEVEKDTNNKVHVQVVGDVYMYGRNYIYEPVYVSVPMIYDYFWTPYYRPYCSSWYWGYYPSYYSYWEPMPLFRYRNHIGIYIGYYGHQYNYVNYRRCSNAYYNYYGRRGNGYERQYPNRSFERRHSAYANRYELDQTRNTRDVAFNNPRNSSIQSSPRATNTRDVSIESTPRVSSPRTDNPRNTSIESTPRVSSPRAENPRNASIESTPRVSSPRSSGIESSPRMSSPRMDSPRMDAPTRSNSGGGRSGSRR